MSAIRHTCLALIALAAPSVAFAQAAPELRGAVSDPLPGNFSDELAGGAVDIVEAEAMPAPLQMEPVIVKTAGPVLRYDTAPPVPVRLAAETAVQDPLRFKASATVGTSARQGLLTWEGRNNW
ncbi:MAG: hypothetical protein R3C13_03215 [Hyphomonas sp.]|uniref:hypothetical protein n=1 Tax=Hyphomonas sp. TaxID=87 RepID=UPI003527A852